MVRLWLIRHGETAWNAEGRFQGWTDVGLTERGRHHAHSHAARLEGRTFDGIWSSDLGRAVETARIVVREEPVADRRLRELDFGAMEGARWDDLDDTTRRALAGFDGFAAPGGESMDGLRARVFEFLETLGEGDHLIVTHGGVIRLLARECDSDGFPSHDDVVVLDWTARARLDPPPLTN